VRLPGLGPAGRRTGLERCLCLPLRSFPLRTHALLRRLKAGYVRVKCSAFEPAHQEQGRKPLIAQVGSNPLPLRQDPRPAVSYLPPAEVAKRIHESRPGNRRVDRAGAGCSVTALSFCRSCLLPFSPHVVALASEARARSPQFTARRSPLAVCLVVPAREVFVTRVCGAARAIRPGDRRAGAGRSALVWSHTLT